MKTWQAYLLIAAVTGFACGFVVVGLPAAPEAVAPAPPCAAQICTTESLAVTPPKNGKGLSMTSTMKCKCEVK